MPKQRILVTSALPYINGVKHLGNLVGSMLPADVYARFERQRRGKQNVLFICATDEHGTPAELAALEEGRRIDEYCTFWHGEQKRLYDGFRLSFDHFGRSSSQQNQVLTQRFAQSLWEEGYLEERTTKQVYSRADGRFLPDRYVVGTCPHCGYDRARGDQCENCTRVLDPVDLIAPRSVVSGSPDIEIRESKHLFLRQSTFEPRLRSWLEAKQNRWPHLVTSIGFKWLDEGLHDRGITRDLTWGVPVNTENWGANPQGNKPDQDALKGKVFYVWFDAPIEYISATWEWADAAHRTPAIVEAEPDGWQSWWRGKSAESVTYVQFMGKDNVPFHVVGFPCTIFGVNEHEPVDQKWKLVDELKGFNWLNYYGGKFSTSEKRGIFLDAALELLPADYWRWYLIANAPESADSSFTWQQFQSIANKDLADVLGNFINRIFKFAATNFGTSLPEGGAWGDAERNFASMFETRVSSYTECLERLQLRKAAIELRAIWALGNEYLAVAKPWTIIKSDREQAAASVRLSLNMARVVAMLSGPIIPDSAAAIIAALNIPALDTWPTTDIGAELEILKPGHSFSVPPVLFSKIDDKQIEEWISRFGGE